MTLKCTTTSRHSTSHILSRLIIVLKAVTRTHLCGYDLNLTYPQNGTFPTLNAPIPDYATASIGTRLRQGKTKLFQKALKEDAVERRSGLSKRDPAVEEARFAKREQWKRDLIGRANGTIDPYYQCDLYSEMIDYALNFSLPWRTQLQHFFFGKS